MLDMGFSDVKRIVKFLPKKRQTLLFSATIPAEIADLAEKMLHEPEHYLGNAERKTGGQDRAAAYFVEKAGKEGTSCRISSVKAMYTRFWCSPAPS